MVKNESTEKNESKSQRKAIKQLQGLLNRGKSVDIVYVYRPPEDAWKGVIHRMLHNKSEMGRIVPLSTFLKNTEGSYNTIAGMLENRIDQLPNVKVSLLDNSLGSGNAEIMSRGKFDAVKFDKKLEEKCRSITQEYFDKGEITVNQYNQLMQ